MKKRILALALAGTTAFSVFGGLNVFAAAAEYDAYVAYSPVANLTETPSADENEASKENSAAAIALAEKLADMSTSKTDINGDTVYSYDYYITDPQKEALDTAITDVLTENVTNNEYLALKKAFAAIKPYTGMDASGTAEKAASADRIEAYNEIVSLKKTMQAAKTAMDTGEGEADENWTNYKLEDLYNAINNITATKKTSEYYALKEAYDYYDAMFGFSSVVSNSYTDKLEKIMAYEPSDYTDTKWDQLQRYVDLAESFAAAEDYTEAMKYLGYAENVTFKTADKSELKSTLASLFTNGAIASTYTGTAPCVYLKADYDTSAKDDAWDVFAVGYTDVDGKAYEAVYTAAYKAYRSSNKRQSEIDKMIVAVEDAVAALDISSSAKDWEILKLEGIVEAAEAFVESDYRTTTTTYKNFVKALENAQNVLDKAVPGKSEIAAVTNTLEGFVNGGLDSVTISNTTARNKLKTAIKDAKKLSTEGKSDYQVLALKNGIAAAEAVANNNELKTISSMTKALDALNDAIANYEHSQGWYQDDKGTWFYGVGTENYTGWLELNGRTYFLKDDGSMAANTWVKTDKGYWYYLNASGAMMHDGWAKINDAWYYFKNFGGMAEGWVKVANTWYYLQPGSGKMVTGWNLINGKYYYFDASGAMLANTTTPDGYKVDASGAWVK